AGSLDSWIILIGQKKDRAVYKQRRFNAAKRRAWRDGIPFTITMDDFVIPDRCPYLDLKISKGISHIAPCSPSLDRINPRKGYIRGNVIVVSQRANIIKQDANATEIEMVAKWLQREEQRVDALGRVATVGNMKPAEIRRGGGHR